MLKQTYTEDSSGQNNDDKVKKPIFGSHAITIVNYCNIFTFFHVTNNKVKAALTVLSTYGILYAMISLLLLLYLAYKLDACLPLFLCGQ